MGLLVMAVFEAWEERSRHSLKPDFIRRCFLAWTIHVQVGCGAQLGYSAWLDLTGALGDVCLGGESLVMPAGG